MIITALMLDDEVSWSNDIKFAIESLPESFFKSLDTNITGIKIITSSDTNTIVEKIQKIKPDIFLIDIELNSMEKGHEIYEKLFVKCIDIPSIAISAYVDTEDFKKEIKDTGVSSFVNKLDASVEQRIAKEICVVLNNPEHVLNQLIAAVNHYEINDTQITVDGDTKSIREFINEFDVSHMSDKTQKNILESIRNVCLSQTD